MRKWLLCLIIVGIAFAIGQERKSEMPAEKQTNVEFFPDLEGVEATYWEDVSLGENSRTPGPTDTQYRGYIEISEEVAKKYMQDYQWQEVNIDMEATNIDVSTLLNDTWYYSPDFNEEIIPDTMMGKIYFNKKGLWFVVTQF